MLHSFNFENQTWGALHKAWKGCLIAKNKDEPHRMKYYAIVIQKIERELGIKVSSFPELSLIALQFFQDQLAEDPILPNKNTWNSLRILSVSF